MTAYKVEVLIDDDKAPRAWVETRGAIATKSDAVALADIFSAWIPATETRVVEAV